MTIHVFTGPTLRAEEGRELLEAIYHPPAAQGDVYRAAIERPVAIAIIDGYFERIPSVSHKEILWAMAQGVHVFGAASMGALRAAELAPFGMEGVGAVYEAFRSGELEADDEVAVAHASGEDHFRPLSEAMVNIRATLCAAEAAGAIGEGSRAALVRIAKGLFYPDRCYPIVLARAAAAGVPPAEIEALQVFLRHGRVQQKREDAVLLLGCLRERFAGVPEPKRIRYHFEQTDAWEHIRSQAMAPRPPPPPGGGAAGAGQDDPALEELKLSGGFAAARRGARARALAIEAARRAGRAVRGAALGDAIEAFRRERGLLAPADMERWIRENGVRDLERFLTEEAHVQWAEAVFEPEVARRLEDHLRSTGEYAPLVARALDKRRVLAGLGAGGAEVSEAELFRWYFEERLCRPAPTDPAEHARAAGFDGVEALREAVLRELRYVRATAR
jgi:hypothetical protein